MTTWSTPTMDVRERWTIRGRSETGPVVTVVFRSGGDHRVEQSRAGTVIATDGEGNHDLALIRVRGVEMPPEPVRLSGTSIPELTTPVLILGFPFGPIPPYSRQPRCASEPVGHGQPEFDLWNQKDRFGQVSRVQLNGGLDPGNSGGPVVDERTGEIVGIAVEKISPDVGFAIPAAELSRMLDGRLVSFFWAKRSERRGLADLEVEATLLDPLKQVRSAEFLYTTDGSPPPGGGPSANGSWPALPSATSVRLELNQGDCLGGISGRRNRAKRPPDHVAGSLSSRLRPACWHRPMPYEVPIRKTDLTPMDAEPRSRERYGSFDLLGPLIDPLKQPAKDCELRRNGAILTIQVPEGLRLLSSSSEQRAHR